mgnify:CR=1 FL=1
MNKKKDVNSLVCGAVIAALYAALTYAASAVNLAYGAVQFRFSEALTVLAAYTPAAIPGLTIGCILANLGSPYGITDIICGSAATLLAAVFTYLTRKVKVKGLPLLAPVFSVVFNAIIVGAEIARGLYVQGLSYTGSICRSRRARGMLRRRNAALRSNKQNGTS